MSNQAPVGTTLAILERTLKVMSAVQARVHYTMKQELQLLAAIIRDYTDPDYTYEPEEGRASAKKSDYSMVEVIPVSDPNAATLSQRVVQYQAVIQLAQMAPQIYNLPMLHRQMLDVLGIKHADKLVPLEDDQKPTDPVTENMNALKGKPLKAFIYQDHESHIKVHQSAMTDPIIQQLIGQNPQAQTITAAMQSHVAEHVGYAYRQKIELALGVALPNPEDEMPEDMEKEISRLMAEAAPQVLAQSKATVAQQQAQQNAQDPILQLQMQELQIKQKEVDLKEKKLMADAAQQQAKQMQELQLKQKEVEIKEKKLMADAAAKADELDIQKQKIESTEKIAGMNATLKDLQLKQALQAKQEESGAKLGVDMAHKRAQLQQSKKTEK